MLKLSKNIEKLPTGNSRSVHGLRRQLAHAAQGDVTDLLQNDDSPWTLHSCRSKVCLQAHT